MTKMIDGSYIGLMSAQENELTKKYELIECISVSTFAETYVVRSRIDGEFYLAKLHHKSNDDAKNERNILMLLDHPAIPEFVDCIHAGDIICNIQKYVDGLSLERLRIPVDEKQVLDIALQLCDVLTYLHNQTPPIIHRDIKPQNVILDDAGKVYLIDFGISRRFNEDAVSDTVFIGTDGFAAPEQYGFQQTDCRADIFSLGILLCYLLTGSRDLRGLGDLSNKKLASVLRKCTAFAPESRYGSAFIAKRAFLNVMKKREHNFYRAAAVLFPIFVYIGFAIWNPVKAYIFAQPTDANIQDEQYAMQDNIFTSESLPSIFSEYVPVSEGENSADYMPIPMGELSTPIEVVSKPSDEIYDDTSATLPEAWDVFTFTEPLIEQAVRLILGKDDDELIFHSDLCKITELYLFGDHVALTYNEFFDLITDYSTPRQRGTLRYLDDISAMESLYMLRIANQPISDISPLAANKNLITLQLTGTRVKNVSPLEELPYLKDISIHGISISNKFFFDKQPPSLRSLSLIVDIPITMHAFTNLTYLTDLNLAHSQINSLDGIESMTLLRTIALHSTAISDFSPLGNLQYLEKLQITDDMEQYLYTLTRNHVIVEVYKTSDHILLCKYVNGEKIIVN